MVIDLSALTKYTDELAIELISKSVLQGRTVQTGLSIQSDIKYKAPVNILSSTLTAQATSCGMSATGSVALSQRDIETCPLTVFEDVCLNDLEQYWTGKLMQAGSYNENIPFEKLYTDDKVNRIQALSEDLLWKGSKDSNDVTGNGAPTGNLALCNGILDVLGFQAGSASVHNLSGATFSKSNAIATIDSIINEFTAEASDAVEEDNLNIYLSYSNFNLLTQALRDGNYFHYDANQGDHRIDGYLGTRFNVIAVRGLNGVGKIVATPAGNIHYGVDMLNDFETFEAFYDRKDDQVYFRSKWKQGVQVAFPEFVVVYTGS